MRFWLSYKRSRPDLKMSTVLSSDLFVGRWALVREISDGSRFSGEAGFEPMTADTLRVSEKGMLVLPDARKIQAYRNWIWRFSGESQLSIFYDEPNGRLYHQLNLVWDDGNWTADGSHQCGDDMYAGVYRLGDRVMEIETAVSGPNKDYRLKSTYRKS